MHRYDPQAIERKGQEIWARERAFNVPNPGPDELAPADTGALRILIGTYGRPAPALAVDVRRPGGSRLTSGRLAAGGPEGHVDIPVRELDRGATGVRVCVTVGGGGRTVLYGSAGRLHLEWLRPGSESWLALAPTVAHRFGLGRWNPLGSVLLAALAVLVVATWAAAAWLVLREVGP